MTLPANLNRKEQLKFEETSAGEVAVRVTGEAVPQGLANEGRVSIVTVTDASWTRLVATPMANRRAASIQATDGFGVDSTSDILLNYSVLGTPAVAPTGTQGSLIVAGSEKFYDVNSNVDFWVRVVSGGGSFNIVFEEIS